MLLLRSLLVAARLMASVAVPPIASPPAPALDALFGAGAVLQMERPVPVWGTCAADDPAAAVAAIAAGAVRAAPPPMLSVRLDGIEVASARCWHTSDGGRWNATLPPQRAGYGRQLAVAVALDAGAGARRAPAQSARTHPTQRSLSFGVVLLCSGQSNMAMGVGGAGAFHKPNKPPFSADNGTAESAASGRFTGKIWFREDTNDTYKGPKSSWQPVSPHTLPGFSAVCWYAGKALYEAALEARGVPLGLIAATVGATPIEYWLPQATPGDPNVNPCETDKPQCVPDFPQLGPTNDSSFFRQYVRPLAPTPVAALLWDQAERDVKCPRSLAAYSCMQRYLVQSWRRTFRSDFVFVGVQLAGYTGPDPTPDREGPRRMISAEMVYRMRLQQERGCEGLRNCSVVPTYDLSCAAGPSGGCPFGSVHQPHKVTIGRRIALHLLRAGLGGGGTFEERNGRRQQAVVAEGPRATEVKLLGGAAAAAGVARAGLTVFRLRATFRGGSPPFSLRPTRNCTTCCDSSASRGHTMDLDASADGSAASWANATAATLVAVAGSHSSVAIEFQVLLRSAPTLVRHTAASIWPQCTLYNREGLPALPFQMNVTG
jgi:hypothetical protein